MEGYSPNDFTKWELFRSYSVSFAYNLEIDGGGKPAAVDGGGAARAHGKSGLSHKTHRRLNESRSHYVATAVSAGYDYNGFGMFADEYVFAAEGHAKAAPCLAYEQAKALPFPPLLVNADGKRVADGQQICKHSWKGKDCPLKSCNYRHVSKDGFAEELESGKAAAIPAQMHKQQQQQQQPGNSSYSASGRARRRLTNSGSSCWRTTCELILRIHSVCGYRRYSMKRAYLAREFGEQIIHLVYGPPTRASFACQYVTNMPVGQRGHVNVRLQATFPTA